MNVCDPISYSTAAKNGLTMQLTPVHDMAYTKLHLQPVMHFGL